MRRPVVSGSPRGRFVHLLTILAVAIGADALIMVSALVFLRCPACHSAEFDQSASGTRVSDHFRPEDKSELKRPARGRLLEAAEGTRNLDVLHGKKVVLSGRGRPIPTPHERGKQGETRRDRRPRGRPAR